MAGEGLWWLIFPFFPLWVQHCQLKFKSLFLHATYNVPAGNLLGVIFFPYPHPFFAFGTKASIGGYLKTNKGSLSSVLQMQLFSDWCHLEPEKTNPHSQSILPAA